MAESGLTGVEWHMSEERRKQVKQQKAVLQGESCNTEDGRPFYAATLPELHEYEGHELNKMWHHESDEQGQESSATLSTIL